MWENRDRIFSINSLAKSGPSLERGMYLYLKDKYGLNLRPYYWLDNNKTPHKPIGKSIDIEFYSRMKRRKTSLQQQGYSVEEINENPDNLIVNQFKDDFESTEYFSERMRSYCWYRDKYSDNSYITGRLMETVKDPDYEKFYSYYGTKGCSARKYQRKDLETGFKDNLNTDSSYIQSQFLVGQRYTRKEIKILLSEIYKKLGISKTAKASDLEEYFDVSESKISNPETGKRERGYEILGIR